jgi:5-methylcytosine-specific restriction endonuclease McrA
MSLRYIKRSAPPRKRRSRPRRGQPTRQEKASLRLAVYERAGGRCELRMHKDCSGDQILPYDGEVLFRAHLVHLKSRGAGGKWTMENCRLGCAPCHTGSMHTEGRKSAFSS